MYSQPMSYESSDSSSPPLNEEKKIPQIQLSKEEINILRECNKESFYYRCLPFALISMGVTYYGIKTGHLSGHAKYGPAFKLSAAAFAGWLVGKFSYRKQCEDKFLTLENSTIGNAIRKKRGYALRGSDSEMGQIFGDEDTPLRDSNYTSYSGDFHSSSRSLNFDKNEPSLELDDRERPSLDSDSNLSGESQPLKQFTTYEELRKKNRENYEKQQYRQPETLKSDNFRRPWNSDSEPLRRTNSNFRDDTAKNTYGDTWDNPKFS